MSGAPVNRSPSLRVGGLECLAIRTYAVGMRRMALCVGLAFALSGCATNPATGKRNFTLVSEKQEVAMGKQAAEEVAATMGDYESAAVQRYVSQLGMKLAAVSERPDLPWSFKVVDDAAVNAFALPGGYIFVTRGLLSHMTSEAQLAVVLGHEIGHVTGRHSARQISRAQVAQIGLAVGMVFSDTLRTLGDVSAGTLQLLFLKYGRDAEHEADSLGYRYAKKAGYDLRQMPEVFATLKRASEGAGGGAGRLPSWLSTHPDPEDRIEHSKEMLAKDPGAGGTVDREQYLRVIDGMVFGENPRQGFFQGNVFKHPEMRFTFALPEGWKGQNMTQVVLGASPNKDGAVQLTVAPKMAPAEALRAFLGKEFIQAAEPYPAPLTTAVPGASARFVAKTEQGTLAGVVSFLSHGGQTFQLLTLTSPEKLTTLEPAFRKTHGSFGPLTDPAALAVQPARLKVRALTGEITLPELKQQSGSPVSTETLATINHVDPGAKLEPGMLVKTVVGTLPPGAQVATGQ